MDSLLHTVLSTVRHDDLLHDGDRVIVGLSGGADSVALLTALLTLREELSLKDIRAVHVHHGLRTETADRDERFVRDLCKRLDVPLQVYRVDVKKEADEHGESLEEAGRRCRYELFDKAADGLDNVKIATAHHRTDQAETVLLNMTRGCGAAGVCGIPAKRGRIIRPLLKCHAEDVRAYCERHQLPFMIDETNTDTTYARNRVRHDVLPTLRSINSKAVEHIAAAAELVAEEHSFVVHCAKQAWRSAQTDNGRYAVRALTDMEPVLFAVGLQTLVRAAGGCAERSHTDRIHLSLGQRFSVTATGNVTVRSDGNVLCIVQPPRCITSFDSEVCVSPSCEIQFRNIRYRIHCLSQDTYRQYAKIHKNLFYFCVSYDMIEQGAVLRSRREGDRFRPFPRGCTKSLKKWCNEEKLTLDERECLPLLCDGQGVLAVLGYAVDERAAVTSQTDRIAWFEPVSY